MNGSGGQVPAHLTRGTGSSATTALISPYLLDAERCVACSYYWFAAPATDVETCPDCAIRHLKAAAVEQQIIER